MVIPQTFIITAVLVGFALSGLLLTCILAAAWQRARLVRGGALALVVIALLLEAPNLMSFYVLGQAANRVSRSQEANDTLIRAYMDAEKPEGLLQVEQAQQAYDGTSER